MSNSKTWRLDYLKTLQESVALKKLPSSKGEKAKKEIRKEVCDGRKELEAEVGAGSRACDFKKIKHSSHLQKVCRGPA